MGRYNNRHSNCVRNKDQKGLKREANKEEKQGNVECWLLLWCSDRFAFSLTLFHESGSTAVSSQTVPARGCMSHLCECKREVFGKRNGKLLFFGKVHGHIEFQVNASLAAGCYLILGCVFLWYLEDLYQIDWWCFQCMFILKDYFTQKWRSGHLLTVQLFQTVKGFYFFQVTQTEKLTCFLWFKAVIDGGLKLLKGNQKR